MNDSVMSSERYPLWCADRGDGDHVEHRYLGPYDTQREACGAGLRCGEDGFVVRRCRRVKASELNFDAEDRVLTDGLDLAACEGGVPAEAWANFEEPIVSPKDGTDFAAAFWAWADASLVVDAFVCESDEEPSAIASVTYQQREAEKDRNLAESGREVVDMVARTIAWHDEVNRSEMPTDSPPIDHGTALVLHEIAQKLGVHCMDEDR